MNEPLCCYPGITSAERITISLLPFQKTNLSVYLILSSSDSILKVLLTEKSLELSRQNSGLWIQNEIWPTFRNLIITSTGISTSFIDFETQASESLNHG